MKLPSRSLFLLAGLLLSGAAEAQTNSAREALGIVSAQFGPRATQWVAEMRGTGGVPQPYEWEIVAFDDRAPLLLYRFGAGGGRATDRGVDRQIYPEFAPSGFFSANQIGVDSVAAFTIAEGEARKAKMAFDSCNYLLRARDFSTDPIWRLDLVDVRRNVVGKIYLSATSGAVLRTIWVYYDQRARPDGEPLIVDSFAPSQGMITTGITGGEYPQRQPAPGESTGIVRMPPTSTEPVPGVSGIAGMPVTPAPYSQVPSPPISSVPPQPMAPPVYRPVDPSGRVMDNTTIPEPPAITPPVVTTPPPASTGGGMADLREAPAASRPDPTKPPINVPGTGAGSTERIPPPPIPR